MLICSLIPEEGANTEPTPGPKCGRKDYVNERFQSNPRPSSL